MVNSERMYNGATSTATVGAYIDLTNTGPTVVNMTGRSFDDDRELHGPGGHGGGGIAAGRQVRGRAGFVAGS